MTEHLPQEVQELKPCQGVIATTPLTFQENEDFNR